MVPRARIQSWRCATLIGAVVALTFLVPQSALRAQQSPSGKKTITHELIWLMKRVGAPVPSPDGRWIVFPVIDPAYDEKDQVSDLWIVPADGSAKPRRLTFSKTGESGAAWSPDSQRLAFSAKREGDEVTKSTSWTSWREAKPFVSPPSQPAPVPRSGARMARPCFS